MTDLAIIFDLFDLFSIEIFLILFLSA